MLVGMLPLRLLFSRFKVLAHRRLPMEFAIGPERTRICSRLMSSMELGIDPSRLFALRNPIAKQFPRIRSDSSLEIEECLSIRRVASLGSSQQDHRLPAYFGSVPPPLYQPNGSHYRTPTSRTGQNYSTSLGVPRLEISLGRPSIVRPTAALMNYGPGHFPNQSGPMNQRQPMVRNPTTLCRGSKTVRVELPSGSPKPPTTANNQVAVMLGPTGAARSLQPSII
ncbi:hypothetical protein SASPL_148417 [Salvia splendens]|uniref:Uncharacterized protein n=1 Tax=Salvia splendens TaxID=180675 RepID=A0A8X8WA42_SALSN|nr:hypothetical protein SASPL_148417 [Salvia splendens]